MRHFITASSDTTLYQAYPAINAGFDEILEIGKIQDTELYGTFFTASAVRSLISFDLSQSGSWNASSSYFLNLRLATAKEVDKGQQIIIGALTQSWDEGSGFFYQEPENRLDGATWTQATTSVSWSLAGGALSTSPTASVGIDFAIRSCCRTKPVAWPRAFLPSSIDLLQFAADKVGHGFCSLAFSSRRSPTRRPAWHWRHTRLIGRPMRSRSGTSAGRLLQITQSFMASVPPVS